MQTKNVNLSQNEANEMKNMAYLSPVRESTLENCTTSDEKPLLAPPSSVYYPVGASPNQNCGENRNGLPQPPCSQPQYQSSTCKSQFIYQTPPAGVCKSSAIYQPPPLPPRGGNPRRSNPTTPVKENHCASETLVNGSSNIGPYKPVPPPKPFAGNQVLGMVHHRFEDSAQNMHNGQVTYPHILVTEQGQFVTHSTKFPIEEGERFQRNFNDKNYSQGIDNPGLVPDSSSMGLRNALHIQQKEMIPNHYAQMRPYDPAKYQQYIPNGHPPPLYQGSHINAQQGQQVQQGHQDNWQNHVVSGRFQSSVNQSPDKRVFMNSVPNKQLAQELNFYPPPSHAQHNLGVREEAKTEQEKNSHYYQESSAISGDQLRYKGVQLNGIPNGEGNCRAQFVSSGGEAMKPNSCLNPEANGGLSQNGGELDDKKDDKWESLKRAGKKYSNFKHMISNKFNKIEAKGNSSSNSQFTQNRGTNSQDLSKSTSALNGDVTNPERFHNGENYLHENKNFQRVVTYSSLKSKLDDPPQHTNGQGAFLNSARHSGRLPYSTVNDQPLHTTYDTQKSNTLNQLVASGPKRAESCTHLGAPVPEQTPKLPQWGIHHRSDDNLTRPLASDQSYPDPVATKLKETVDGRFLPSREGRVSGSSDSGRGTGGGSASEFKGHDTSLESGSSNRNPMPGHSSGNESEWIDIPDSDDKQIQQFGAILHNSSKYPEGSKTPPLPPLSPEGTPRMGGPRNSKPKKNTPSHRNMKPDIVETTEKNCNKKSTNSSTNENSCTNQHSGVGNLPKSKVFTTTIPTMGGHGMFSTGRDRGVGGPQNKFHSQQMKAREKEWRTTIDDDDDDITSTDAALDLNSVLDGATEVTTDDDLASTRDDHDAYLIRRQLEGLEGMYSEVLKVLGGRKNSKAADPRLLRRKLHGSMSSLPSSVMSSRCIRDKKGKVIDDRLRRTTKETSRSTHKRFQRLESHVVTLARSVAHLSSEMRTQQLMLQEMESIRNDISALKLNVKSPSSMLPLRGGPLRGSRLWNGIGSQHPSLSNPGKVKKLTQFFGDEPPLVRIFLKKLGYEKYAPVFEQEKIGMLELPYMTEDRLQKIGIPLGPRLRILEESRGPITTDGNLSVYVV